MITESKHQGTSAWSTSLLVLKALVLLIAIPGIPMLAMFLYFYAKTFFS